MRVSPVIVCRTFGVVFAVLSIIASISISMWLHVTVTAEAQLQVRRVTTATAAQTLLVLESVDAVLRHAAVEMTRHGLLWPHPDRAALKELLVEDMVGMPHTRGIYVIRWDGEALASSEAYPVAPEHMVQEEFLRELREHRVGAVHIGRRVTVFGEFGPGAFIPVARRIERDGKYEGVVVALVDAAALTQLFARMALGAEWAMQLIRTDGERLIDYPRNDVSLKGEEISESTVLAQYGVATVVSVIAQSIRNTWSFVIYAILLSAVISSLLMFAIVVYSSARFLEYDRTEEARERARWTPTVIDGGRDA